MQFSLLILLFLNYGSQFLLPFSVPFFRETVGMSVEGTMGVISIAYLVSACFLPISRRVFDSRIAPAYLFVVGGLLPFLSFVFIAYLLSVGSSLDWLYAAGFTFVLLGSSVLASGIVKVVEAKAIDVLRVRGAMLHYALINAGFIVSALTFMAFKDALIALFVIDGVLILFTSLMISRAVSVMHISLSELEDDVELRKVERFSFSLFFSVFLLFAAVTSVFGLIPQIYTMTLPDSYQAQKLTIAVSSVIAVVIGGGFASKFALIPGLASGKKGLTIVKIK